eukprot:COSAG03_NODE_300_length_9209_cov_10.443139_3_plen_101_part_00
MLGSMRLSAWAQKIRSACSFLRAAAVGVRLTVLSGCCGAGLRAPSTSMWSQFRAAPRRCTVALQQRCARPLLAPCHAESLKFLHHDSAAAVSTQESPQGD